MKHSCQQVGTKGYGNPPHPRPLPHGERDGVRGFQVKNGLTLSLRLREKNKKMISFILSFLSLNLILNLCILKVANRNMTSEGFLEQLLC